MRYLRKISVAIVMLIATTATYAEIRFAVTEVAGLEALQTEFGAFRDKLEKTTGEKVAFFPINGRTAAVEAMSAGQVDFILVGPAEYVVFKERAAAIPVVAWQRLEYYSQIVVPADSELSNIKDLKGATVAFGDVGSTSAHLAPAVLLDDIGLRQGRDFKALNIHRNVSVEAMLRGDVDAVAMSSAHLAKIRSKFKDASFRVISRGPDLPNDLIIAAKHVDKSKIDKMRKVFVENQKALLDAAMQSDENKKYGGGQFIVTIKDNDYDYIRKMYAAIGMKDFARFIGE